MVTECLFVIPTALQICLNVVIVYLFKDRVYMFHFQVYLLPFLPSVARLYLRSSPIKHYNVLSCIFPLTLAEGMFVMFELREPREDEVVPHFTLRRGTCTSDELSCSRCTHEISGSRSQPKRALVSWLIQTEEVRF